MRAYCLRALFPAGCAERWAHRLGEKDGLGDCGPTHADAHLQPSSEAGLGGALGKVSSGHPLLHGPSVPLILKSLTVHNPQYCTTLQSPAVCVGQSLHGTTGNPPPKAAVRVVYACATKAVKLRAYWARAQSVLFQFLHYLLSAP